MNKTLRGKSDGLNHIFETLGEEFTGNFISLKESDPEFYEKALEFMKINEVHEALLRSSGNFEGRNIGLSFAGVCESRVVELETLLKTRRDISCIVDEDYNAKELRKLAKFRGFELGNLEMNFILHEYFRNIRKASFMEHPNLPGNYKYELHTYWPVDELISRETIHQFSQEKYFSMLIDCYQKLTKELDPNFTYLLEIGEHKISSKGFKIFQITPVFRKSDTIINPEMAKYFIGNIPQKPIEFNVIGPANFGNSILLQNRKNNKYSLIVDHIEIQENPHSFRLPLDFQLEKRLEAMFILGEPCSHFLDHIGISNIEGVDFADFYTWGKCLPARKDHDTQRYMQARKILQCDTIIYEPGKLNLKLVKDGSYPKEGYVVDHRDSLL